VIFHKQRKPPDDGGFFCYTGSINTRHASATKHANQAGFLLTPSFIDKVPCYTYAICYMDEDEISSTDQYIYDSYSGLNVYGTEMDSDECEMPESMNDI